MHQIGHITVHRIRNVQSANLGPCGQHRVLGNRRRWGWSICRAVLRLLFAAHQSDNLHLILDRAIGDFDMEQEPVHLRFG